MGVPGTSQDVDKIMHDFKKYRTYFGTLAKVRLPENKKSGLCDIQNKIVQASINFLIDSSSLLFHFASNLDRIPRFIGVRIFISVLT